MSNRPEEEMLTKLYHEIVYLCQPINYKKIYVIQKMSG